MAIKGNKMHNKPIIGTGFAVANKRGSYFVIGEENIDSTLMMIYSPADRPDGQLLYPYESDAKGDFNRIRKHLDPNAGVYRMRISFERVDDAPDIRQVGQETDLIE
jgi:hypothetical protein